jgi:hypothetical protein
MADDDKGNRTSPRKHKRSGSASDAAKNIVKNKEAKNNKNANPKKRSDKDATEVGTNDNGPNKAKGSNALGITNESDESNGDNFEQDAEKKEQDARKRRKELRQNPEKMLEAQKTKDAEDRHLQKLAGDKNMRSTSPTLSEVTPDETVEDALTQKSTSSTTSASKKKNQTEGGNKQRSVHPLHRTGRQ